MDFISFIRFLATLLITNSHFDTLYPEGFSWMSTGGALGNALFFLVSGYTLYRSSRNDFTTWILRRYSKIFPNTWIFLFVTGTLGLASYTFLDWALLTRFWFLNAIIVFYPIFFFAIRIFEKRLWILWCLTAAPWLATFFKLPHEAYIIESGELCFRWYPYFCIMILGALFARTESSRRESRSNRLGGSPLLKMGGGSYCWPFITESFSPRRASAFLNFSFSLRFCSRERSAASFLPQKTSASERNFRLSSRNRFAESPE